MIVLCNNYKCEHYRSEIDKIDKTNCRIFMWDEIENCPESIIECAKNTEQQVQVDSVKRFPYGDGGTKEE